MSIPGIGGFQTKQPHWKSGQMVSVVLFDQVLYRPGAMVDRWMHGLVNHFVLNAIRAAPMRTGHLRSGIRGHARAVGERQMEGLIESTANHTLFVIRGTRGEIWSHGDHKLKLRPGPSHPYRSAAWVVDGQSANNFMAKAWRTTSHQHSVLRGKGMPPL